MNSSENNQQSPALNNLKLIAILIVVGLILFILMWIIFLTGSFNLYDEPTVAFFQSLHDNAPAWVTTIIDILTKIGSQGITVAVVILLGLYAFRRQFRRFWLMFTAVAGGELLWLALIHLINRPRPTEVTAVTGVKLPGFPSGHVMLFIAFFGALIYIDYLKKRDKKRLLTLSIIAGLLGLFSGLARLYFSAHYLTDVIAGYGIGLAWTAFALTLAEWGWLKWQNRKK